MPCPTSGTECSLPGGRQPLRLPFALSLPQGDVHRTDLALTVCQQPAGRPSTDLRPREQEPGKGWQQAGSRTMVSAGLP